MYREMSLCLTEWKSTPNRKPVILKGVRQVGKTWLLKDFGARGFKNCHYVNLEVFHQLGQVFATIKDPVQIVRELEYLLRTKIDVTTDLLILDEIQAIPDAVTSLKYFYESMPELALCTAGSLIGTFLGESPFPVGKTTIKQLHPLTFAEFLLAQGEAALCELLETHDLREPLPLVPHTQLSELWRFYIVTGGMPEAVDAAVQHGGTTFEAARQARFVQSQLIMAYLADMAKHSGQVNAHHMERIYRAVPMQLAQTVDSSARRFVFKGVIPGVKGYAKMASAITWLERAGLVHRVPVLHHVEAPLRAFTKENMFKLYLSDTGILGAASDLAPATILAYDFATFKGYFLENAIHQEMVAAGMTPYCWEGRTAEVEFVVQHGDAIIPIEVKAGNRTKSKSLSAYRTKFNPRVTITLTNLNKGRSGQTLMLPHYTTGQLPRLLDMIA